MIGDFRDDWLESFFEEEKRHRLIPSRITSALARKLDILMAAESSSDLISPPSNRFEHLSGRLSGYCSIRVNRQYRLIFVWEEAHGKATDVYLDPHTYK